MKTWYVRFNVIVGYNGITWMRLWRAIKNGDTRRPIAVKARHLSEFPDDHIHDYCQRTSNSLVVPLE